MKHLFRPGLCRAAHQALAELCAEQAAALTRDAGTSGLPARHLSRHYPPAAMKAVIAVKSNVTDSGLKNSWDTVPR